MTAILNNIIGGRRGRLLEKHDLDSVYGDINITAPVGFPAKHVDGYIRQLKPRSDVNGGGHVDDYASGSDSSILKDDASFSSLSDRSSDSENERFAHKAVPKSRTRPLPCDSRHRSRSQSATTRDKQETVVHRGRSSSTNRMHKLQEPDHHLGEVRDSFMLCSSQALDFVVPTERSTPKQSQARAVSPNYPTMSHTVATGALTTLPEKQSSSNSHKVSHQPLDNIKSVLERSNSPAITILSPVSESFGTESRSKPSIVPPVYRTNSPLRNPKLAADERTIFGSVHNLNKTDCNVTTSLTAVAASRPRKMPSKPSISHRTHHIRSQSQSTGTRAGPGPVIQRTLSPVANTDKPLPSCPIGSSRSPPLGCTAFMRASSRTGPGLAATAIMRPASRNESKYSQMSPQIAPAAHRQRMRSASLSRVESPLHLSRNTTPVNIFRKGSYPEESGNQVSGNALARTCEANIAPGQSPAAPARMKSPPIASTTYAYETRTTTPVAVIVPPRKSSYPSSHGHDASEISQPPKSTASPAPSLASTNLIGGNIYDALRDDLRFVAHDINEIRVEQQREKDSKHSRLRTRARSVSRLGHREHRDRDHRRDPRRDPDSNYNYGHMEKAGHAGGWGNIAYVPAYDQPDAYYGTDSEHDRGESYKVKHDKGPKLVPDYDDLWS